MTQEIQNKIASLEKTITDLAQEQNEIQNVKNILTADSPLFQILNSHQCRLAQLQSELSTVRSNLHWIGEWGSEATGNAIAVCEALKYQPTPNPA